MYTRKRMILFGTAILVSIIAIFIIHQTVVRPHVTIVAAPGSAVAITRISDGQLVATQKTSDPSTTIALDTGVYSVTVDSGTGKWLTQVTAELFHNQKLQDPKVAKLTAATVVRHVAYNPVAGSTSLSFLNTSKRTIESIDQNGTLSELDTTRSAAMIDDNNTGPAQSLHIISNNRAIAVSENKLYLLQDGKLSPLNMDGLPTDINQILVATSPTEGSFAVAVNKILYWYASPEGTAQQVLTFSKIVDQIAYGGNTVIAYSTRMPLAKEDIKSAYSQYAVDPLVINISSKTQKTLTNGPVIDASISPDGNYATLELQGASQTMLYDMGQHAPLYNIPNPDVTTPTWTDNTHFVYGRKADIWSFDVTNQTGITIGTLPDDMQPTSITFGGNDYYVTTYNSEDSATVFRLSKTPVDHNAERAASLDAAAQDNPLFNITYINISRPTLYIPTNVISNNPTQAAFNTLTLQSRQAALDYVYHNQVDPTKLTIVYDPATL